MNAVTKEAFLGLIASETASELASIHGECTRINSEFAKASRYHSTLRLSGLSSAYVEGLRRHRMAIFDRWATYIKPHASPSNIGACQLLALEAFDTSLATISADHQAFMARECANIPM